MNPRFAPLIPAMILCAALCPAFLAGPPATDRGVVVEEMDGSGAADVRALRPGDRILSWERDGESGTIDTPFDWLRFTTVTAPRGGVILVGQREGVPIKIPAPQGIGEMTVQPVLSERGIHLFKEGARLIEAGDLQNGLSSWRELANLAEGAGETAIHAWILMRSGESLSENQRWDEARNLLYEALKSAEGLTVVEIGLWNALGVILESKSDFPGAETAYGNARALRGRLGGEDLGLADSLFRLADVTRKRGQLDPAQEYYERSLEIRKRLAPGSLEVADCLHRLGITERRRGRLEKAEEYLGESLSIQKSLNPEGPKVSGSLISLGLLALIRGDLNEAERLHLEALAIQEKQEPESRETAMAINNLGVIARRRGDMKGAEDRYRRSLEIRKKLSPDGLDVAMSLNNLGIVAKQRGDLATAEEYYLEALRIREALAPESDMVGDTLNNLANLYRRRGEFGKAEAIYGRSLRIQESIAPKSIRVAAIWTNLGVLADTRGDYALSEKYHRKVLEVYREVSPDSLDCAQTLDNLGAAEEALGNRMEAERLYRESLDMIRNSGPGSHPEGVALDHLGTLLRDRGNLEEAEETLAGALRIFEKLAPGSLEHSDALFELGRLHLARNELGPALDFFMRSLDAFENQRGRLGGSEETRARYTERYGGRYRELMEILIREGKSKDAYHILERYRAQGLLRMLAERELIFDADVPAELEWERIQVNQQYDDLQDELRTLSLEREPEKQEKLALQIEEIRQRMESLRKRIRAGSPRLASLRYPQPLTFDETRKLLDPGTLLLSYAVGEHATILFAVEKGLDEPRVIELEVGRGELERSVKRLRSEVRSLGPVREMGLLLFNRLLEPVLDRVEGAERLVICPDGPLHFLPFGMLGYAPVHGKGFRYLVEEKPIHLVVSATVFGELAKDRRGLLPQGRIVAFGDPSYGPKEDAEAGTGPLRGGDDLVPLPLAREEVLRIGEFYGDRSEIWLGAEATEERAKAIPKNTSILHFACHGRLDERFPMDSALVLAIPPKGETDRENGFLQAWEIFEQIRVDADLVVLSACETALGEEIGGEGLVGLTRAFQYAGSRSVVASLWNVSDATTAEFMGRFYAHLDAGKTKDEALRRAKLDFIANPIRVRNPDGLEIEYDASHPFHWAGFQLIGDWK